MAQDLVFQNWQFANKNTLVFGKRHLIRINFRYIFYCTIFTTVGVVIHADSLSEKEFSFCMTWLRILVCHQNRTTLDASRVPIGWIGWKGNPHRRLLRAFDGCCRLIRFFFSILGNPKSYDGNNVIEWHNRIGANTRSFTPCRCYRSWNCLNNDQRTC